MSLAARNPAPQLRIIETKGSALKERDRRVTNVGWRSRHEGLKRSIDGQDRRGRMTPVSGDAERPMLIPIA
jgi:hypothetical protein